MKPEVIAREIVAREGGYVDDPDDPGGATKHGVTLATLRRLGRDLNGDGQIDKADVAVLDEEDAAEIFLAEYYRRPHIDRLPVALQPVVFDMQVHAGAAAVSLLQRLLRKMGFAIAVDGIIGPETIHAARAALAPEARLLVDAYAIERRNWYYRLADRHERLRKFVTRRDGGKGGWIARAEAFLSPDLHLSDAAHRARVARWGRGHVAGRAKTASEEAGA